jgi:hypothetical protein
MSPGAVRLLQPPTTRTRCVPVFVPALANSTDTSIRICHLQSFSVANLSPESIYDPSKRNGSNRQLQAGLTRYFDFYNRRRIHQSHEYQTPDQIYYASNAGEPLAIAA